MTINVSIHASRFREAMPGPWSNDVTGLSVSIHASRFREAMRRRRQRLACQRIVSIHASRFREAMRWRARCRRLSRRCFNPRLPFPGGDAAATRGHIHGPGCFNPRLPFPGGDARLTPRQSPLPRSFNPRLPFPGGDAFQQAGEPLFRPVSIHASRFREAMLPQRRGAPGRSVVSIHASRFREAMPWCGSTRAQRRNMFQSTPPVSGRRCSLYIVGLFFICRFNPRLPFPGGDAPKVGELWHFDKVSIHASRFREAMHPKLETPAAEHAGFNPRLPFPGGDALGKRLVALRVLVSIHASRFREAMQQRNPDRRRDVVVSIHASRFREAMPAGPGGMGGIGMVSIHASRFREAMLDQWVSFWPGDKFQSTPPVSGRRCSAWTSACRHCRRFQSTPPVSGRRCLIRS